MVLPKMEGYVKNFNDGGKDKNNKLMPSCIDDKKILEKYETIWTKIEDLKNIELNASRVYNDGYIKTKIRTYGEKVCINFFMV